MQFLRQTPAELELESETNTQAIQKGNTHTHTHRAKTGFTRPPLCGKERKPGVINSTAVLNELNLNGCTYNLHRTPTPQKHPTVLPILTKLRDTKRR